MSPNQNDWLTANQQLKLFISIMASQSQCCPKMTMEHRDSQWLIEYQQIREGLLSEYFAGEVIRFIINMKVDASHDATGHVYFVSFG